MSILQKIVLCSSLLGAAAFAAKTAPQAWKMARTDRRYALEMIYGAALVGGITGFQLILTAPLLIPQEIAFRRGYIKRPFNIAMVNYVAQGKDSSMNMDYATRLNPVEGNSVEKKDRSADVTMKK